MWIIIGDTHFAWNYWHGQTCWSGKYENGCKKTKKQQKSRIQPTVPKTTFALAHSRSVRGKQRQRGHAAAKQMKVCAKKYVTSSKTSRHFKEGTSVINRNSVTSSLASRTDSVFAFITGMFTHPINAKLKGPALCKIHFICVSNNTCLKPVSKPPFTCFAQLHLLEHVC